MKKFYLIALIGMLGMPTVFGQIPVKQLSAQAPFLIQESLQAPINKKYVIPENFKNGSINTTRAKTPPTDTTYQLMNYAESILDNYGDVGAYGSAILVYDSLLYLEFSGDQYFPAIYASGIYAGFANIFDPVSNFMDKTYSMGITSYNSYYTDSIMFFYTYDRPDTSFNIIDSISSFKYYAYSFTADGDTVTEVKMAGSKTYTYTQVGSKVYYSHTINGDTLNNVILSIDSTYTYKQDTGKNNYDTTLNTVYTVVKYAYNSNNPDSIIDTVWRYTVINYTFDTLTKVNVDSVISTNLDTLTLDSAVIAIYDTIENTPVMIINYDYTGANPTAIKDTLYRWPLDSYTIDINGDTINTTTASISKKTLDSIAIVTFDSIKITKGPIDTLLIYIMKNAAFSDFELYWPDLGLTAEKIKYDYTKNAPSTYSQVITILLDSSYATSGTSFGILGTAIDKVLSKNGELIGAAFSFKHGTKYKDGDNLYTISGNDITFNHGTFALGMYKEIDGDVPTAYTEDIVYENIIDQGNTLYGHSKNEDSYIDINTRYNKWDLTLSNYPQYLNGTYRHVFARYGDPDFTDEHQYLWWNVAPIGAFFDYAVTGCVVEFVASSNTGVDSWKWAFGDGGSSLTQNPTYTYPSKKTSYEVCATGTNSSTGKKYVACKTIDVGFCTGIEDFDISNMVNIHPNPTNGLINIEFDLDAIENIKTEVYNLIGEKIVETLYENVSISKNQLDLSQNPAGVYFIKLSTGDRSTVKKVTLVK